jgi:hypothetical protein
MKQTGLFLIALALFATSVHTVSALCTSLTCSGNPCSNSSGSCYVDPGDSCTCKDKIISGSTAASSCYCALVA